MAISQFERVPNHYGGPLIQKIKDFRLGNGKRSLDPTLLQIGRLEILVPRDFGFCFGVERAIHMAFSALDKHPEKDIHLVSQIIHNPVVNNDLQERGIRFIYNERGEREIDEEEIKADDIVLIPAFGTTVQVEQSLQNGGIDTSSEEYRQNYDTTCPFVSRVWDRGEQLGREGYTVIIHGKFRHEETQAMFSHTERHAKLLVVLDKAEAGKVCDFIEGDLSLEEFSAFFAGKWTTGFDPRRDLERIAVVNQTTMLADETREIAALLRQAMKRRYGPEKLDYHFADTGDTLCYATNQNQNATRTLLDSKADLAIIVGGYNSSNTSHLVEICSETMPSYFIKNSEEILSPRQIRHYQVPAREVVVTDDWLPQSLPVRVAVTSGASCPDVLLNEVIETIAGFYGYGPAEIEAGLDSLSILA